MYSTELYNSVPNKEAICEYTSAMLLTLQKRGNHSRSFDFEECHEETIQSNNEEGFKEYLKARYENNQEAMFRSVFIARERYLDDINLSNKYFQLFMVHDDWKLADEHKFWFWTGAFFNS
jgi:hypothetical protein